MRRNLVCRMTALGHRVTISAVDNGRNRMPKGVLTGEYR